MKRRIVFQPGVTGEEIFDWLKAGREDFACTDASCAPPPVGTGGSRKGGGPATKIIDKTRADGGATLNPRALFRSVNSGYVVSENPQASFSKPMDDLTSDDVDGWLAEHGDLLSKRGNHVGAWHDTDTGQVWLDVVRVYPNTASGKRTAIASGRRHNQIAIWHLDSQSEIRTGGDGKVVAASLIAACYVRACAPPPVGSGGSSSGAAVGKVTHRDPKKLAQSILAMTKRKGTTATVNKQQLKTMLEGIAGDKRYLVDLGKVNVSGTRLFAKLAGVIDRSKMPQIPDDHRDEFIAELRSQGIKVEDRKVDPRRLKPTQSNLSAPKVGKMLLSMRREGWFGKPILVTSDGYILDGHHRWAAKTLHAMESSGQKMPVTRIDASIKDVLAIGVAYDKANGIPLQGLDDTARAA